MSSLHPCQIHADMLEGPVWCALKYLEELLSQAASHIKYL